MTPAESPAVLGADVAAGHWVGVVWGPGELVRAVTAPTVDALLARAAHLAGPLAVVGLDIPVGLPDAGPRAADVLVRRLLGPRGASVFTTPVRASLLEPDHARAVAVNRELTGQGVSRQAHGLRHKVLEVEDWVRGAGSGGPRVVEVHPELSFAELAGAPLRERKKSFNGARRRAALLRGAGLHLPEDLGAAGDTGAVDDVLDAAAAAWSARRVAGGLARSVPDPAERFTDGWPAAIWV